jgi:SAM-dependent methyltransferase
MLPQHRYARACEPGCGAGETTTALALRCDSVVASDASAAAVRQARARVAGAANVRVDQARMPRDWPAGRFDLVVVSELGYYLSGDELGQLAEACRAALSSGGTLVACHWRRVEPDMLQRAQDVHAELQRRTGLWPAGHYEDDDFLLDVWSTDARSVAQREGLA